MQISSLKQALCRLTPYEERQWRETIFTDKKMTHPNEREMLTEPTTTSSSREGARLPDPLNLSTSTSCPLSLPNAPPSGTSVTRARPPTAQEGQTHRHRNGKLSSSHTPSNVPPSTKD